jgi:YidC/Oxa1 family membrane protein insertase
MRELKPELDKIKEKYGNTKDPELLKKSQQEQTALLSKHGANPLSGCLPMLIQFPLFIALNTVMRQAALYIASLKEMYEKLASALLEIPGLIGFYNETPGAIQQLADGSIPGLNPIIPPAWSVNLQNFSDYLHTKGVFYQLTLDQLRDEIAAYGSDVIVLGLPEHLARVINKFTADDWNYVYENIADVAQRQNIQEMAEELAHIETFLGVSIVESSGWGFPGILIPIFTGVSMFISSWLMQQRTYDPNADERTVMMQKMMLTVMPVMMMFFTVSLVAAVGVFWITGQIFQITMDLISLKRTGTKIRLPFAKPEPEVVDVIPVKKKKK